MFILKYYLNETEFKVLSAVTKKRIILRCDTMPSSRISPMFQRTTASIFRVEE
jgi:hypothetical protein